MMMMKHGSTQALSFFTAKSTVEFCGNIYLLNLGLLNTASNSPKPVARLRSKETWYFVKEGEALTNKVEVTESMMLGARLDMNEDMRQAITNEENGLMKAGALPKVTVASASGNKALMEAIGEKAGCFTQSGFLRLCYLSKESKVLHGNKSSFSISTSFKTFI